MGYTLGACILIVIITVWLRQATSATLKCGSGQCLNNTVCCPGEKECCSGLDLCCGEHCCRQGYECCQGSQRCCKTAASCCGDSICCPENTTCCPKMKQCCPRGFTCCDDSGGCCPENSQCCGKYCCAQNTKCCSDGSGCYGDGFYCCGNGLACREGTSCCGNKCCPQGTQCCGDTCCIMPEETTSSVALTISALSNNPASSIQPPYKQTSKLATEKPETGQPVVSVQPAHSYTQGDNIDQPLKRGNGEVLAFDMSNDLTYILFPIVAGVSVIIVVLVCFVIVRKTDTDVGEKMKGYAKKVKEIVTRKN